MISKKDDSTKKKVKISANLKNEVNRGAWTAEEDQNLVEAIEIHGARRWKTIAAKAGLSRCGKSCRLRWMNYLRPDIKRGNISHQEEDLILRLHKLLGNRWSLIAGRLPGRTDNEIKNYWNSRLSKKSSAQKETEKQNGSDLGYDASPSLQPWVITMDKVNEEEVRREEDTSASIVGDDCDASKVSFNVDDFFNFSNEDPFTLDWVSRFLQPR